jgi:hypothetical protein
MADAKITISATDLASDVFQKVSDALKQTGESSLVASEHVEKLGHSFVERVAEGILLRDAIHGVIDIVKEGITSFPELVEHTIKVGNSLFEMSLKTGASVENLSALRFVASQTGLDFDKFGTTLFKMEQALGASGAKADEMQKHLDVLGLNLQTLKNEKPDQAFIDIMSALEEIPNRADQAAVGMAIFGKGFKDMAGLTQESITDLMQEAKDLGLVMSTETAASAHAAEIGMKSLSMQFEAVGMEIASAVLPALVAVTGLIGEQFHDAVSKAGHPIVDLKGSVESVILTMLDWSGIAIDAAQVLDHAFLGTKSILFNIETAVVDVAMAFLNLTGVAANVAAKIPGLGDSMGGVRDAMKDAYTWAGGLREGLAKEADGALDSAAKHDQFFNTLKAGVDGVKDHFHEGFTAATAKIEDFADKSHKAYGGVGADVEGAKDKIDKFGDAMNDLMSAGDGWRGTLDTIDGKVVEASKAYLDAGVSAGTLKEVYRLTETQVKAITKAHEEDAAAVKALAEIHKETLKALAEIHKETFKLALEHEKGWRDEAEKTAKTINESVAHTLATYVDFSEKNGLLALHGTDLQIEQFDRAQRAEIAKLGERTEQNATFWDQAKQQIDEFYDYQRGHLYGPTAVELQQLADDARSAYEEMVASGEYSAASIAAAWHKAYLAENADRIAEQAEWDAEIQQLSGAFTQLAQVAGGSFGGIMKDIGGLIAQMNVLDKATANYDEGVAKMQDGQAGGYAEVGTSLIAMGGQAVSAYNEIQQGGAAATTKGIASMTMTGAAIGSIIPGIGTAVGAGIGAIVGVFAKLTAGASAAELEGRKVEKAFEDSFGGFDGMMKAVGTAYESTGRTAQQAQIDVKALMDAEVQGGQAATDAANKVKQAFLEQQQDAVDLDAAVKKYKFTIEELGPAMQKQQLTQQAVGLENDFRVLVGSGVDVKTVIDHMGTSINDFLHNAQKTGSEVPSEMKPILEKMVEMGTLTDENGNKITDLGTSGITFSETMTQGFGKIVDKLSELINKIAGTTGALNSLPTSKTIDIVYNQRTTGDGPPGGSRGGDEPSYANEGYDLTMPQRAIVGDNPLQSESVLHASTVRDIVTAARNAGASVAQAAPTSNVGLESRIDALTALLKRQGDQLASMITTLPISIQSAMLTAGTRR